jgi:hypothetical protein
MIIGVSGKKGSGKDTVAKILQYFTLPEELRTISIDEWVYELSYHEEVSDKLSTYLEVQKFAGKLKDCVSLLLNIPKWKLESEDYKQQLLPECWDTWVLEHEAGMSIHATKEEAVIIANYLRLPENAFRIEKESLTIRDLLQIMGTDAMRDVVHPNIWVNSLFQEYQPVSLTNIAKASLKTGATTKIIKEPTWPSWVVSDVRFMNEANAIKYGLAGQPVPKNDFRFLVRVNRPIRKSDSSDEHQSETELDDYQHWDYVIENDKNLDNLAFEIHCMLKSKKEFEKYFHI